MDHTTDSRKGQTVQHPLIHANTRREKYKGPPIRWDWPGLATGPFPRKKTGLGSFDATVILGESPYVSRFALFQQIKGNISKPSAKFAELAEMGTLFEPVIAELYRRRTNRQLIDRAQYKPSGRWDTRRHKKYHWMVAAPDMEVEDPKVTGGEALAVDLTVAGNGILEMKSKDSWGEFFDEEGNPPMEVLIQVQHQLAVCDVEWASIAVLMGRRFYWVDIPRNDDFIEFLIAEEFEFWERLFNDDPPPVDGHGSTGEALNAKYPGKEEIQAVELPEVLSQQIVEQYDNLEKTIKDHETSLETLKNEIKLAMGNAEESYIMGGGVNFTWRKSKDASDYFRVAVTQSEEALAQLKKMNAELKKGKKGAKRFTRSRAKVKKKGKTT